MTLALGMIADDGFVVAADSQATAGDWKFEHGKIWSAQLQGTQFVSTFLMTGTGTLSYLQAAWEALRPVFMVDLTLEQQKERFAEAFAAFIERHIVPFSQLPLFERPSVGLLIACVQGGQAALWQAEYNVLTGAGAYAALGNGGMLANSIMARLVLLPFLPCVSTAILAGYLINLVKASDVSVGKRTEIWCVRGGRLCRVRPLTSERIDRWAESYQGSIEPLIFRRALRENDQNLDQWLSDSQTEAAHLKKMVEADLNVHQRVPGQHGIP